MRPFHALLGLLVLAGTAVADPALCEKRFEVAKQELIRRGFHPTSDRDTEKWLVIAGDATSVTMGVEMGGGDSAHTGYWVSVEKAKVAKASDWRFRMRALCCDDWHESSDHVLQFTWERKTRGFVSQIVIDRLGDFLKESKTDADLFFEVARRAAEACAVR